MVQINWSCHSSLPQTSSLLLPVSFSLVFIARVCLSTVRGHYSFFLSHFHNPQLSLYPLPSFCLPFIHSFIPTMPGCPSVRGPKTHTALKPPNKRNKSQITARQKSSSISGEISGLGASVCVCLLLYIPSCYCRACVTLPLLCLLCFLILKNFTKLNCQLLVLARMNA